MAQIIEKEKDSSKENDIKKPPADGREYTNEENHLKQERSSSIDTKQDNVSEENTANKNVENPLVSLVRDKMKAALVFLTQLTLSVLSHPSGGGVVKEAEISGSVSGIPPLISFDKGGVGVNFLGYHARAGLGGLLTGNAADGGLHAEAGTPHGQYAGAGLGGTVAQGRAGGGLYAGATAGGGVSAAAGLDGATHAGGSSGGLYAGAAAGGQGKSVSLKGSTNVAEEVEVVKEKTVEVAPPVISQRTVVATPVVKEKTVHVSSAPAASAAFSGGIYLSKSAGKPVETVEVVEEEERPLPPPPPPQKTYIERTVIPNYVEKTIQVPSYVEKTIRVPTVVEKRVKVPAPPTIIEKEVVAPEVPPPPATNVHIQKTKTVYRPALRKHYWRKYGSGNIGVASRFGSAAEVQKPVVSGGEANIYVEKRADGRLFDDIFNIPISTLQAVNRLVGGIAGGVSGSFSASKSYSTY